VWATIKAYGREGHRRIVEHCLDIARHFANVVNEKPQLELMNDVQLNIVAFRYNLADGRFLVGTSRIGLRTIFRPAFSNWRTRPEDVEEFADVVVEVAESLALPHAAGESK
jgi:hypothetical protein